MKQFIVDRHTTPNTPTLEQVPTEKIPIYENRAAVTADLANLSVGQIVATKDTGDELAQPVDVVESGNMHAITSNAVANLIVIEEKTITTGGDGMAWGLGKEGYTILTATITSTHSGNINQVKVNSPSSNAEGIRFLDPTFASLGGVTLTVKVVYAKIGA